MLVMMKRRKPVHFQKTQKIQRHDDSTRCDRGPAKLEPGREGFGIMKVRLDKNFVIDRVTPRYRRTYIYSTRPRDDDERGKKNQRDESVTNFIIYNPHPNLSVLSTTETLTPPTKLARNSRLSLKTQPSTLLPPQPRGSSPPPKQPCPPPSHATPSPPSSRRPHSSPPSPRPH